MNKKKTIRFLLFSAFLLGIASGVSHIPALSTLANTISSIFLNYLSSLASPIIFFSIFYTFTSVQLSQLKVVAKRVFIYTVITTFLAAAVALSVFLAIDPICHITHHNIASVEKHSYLQFLVDIVPGNFFKALYDNKVISIAFFSIILGIAFHFIDEESKASLQKGAKGLFQIFLKLVGIISFLMPVVVWAFTTQLIQEIRQHQESIKSLFLYLLTVILANLIQGIVVLPILLKVRGLSPLTMIKNGYSALTVAFMTKSSNATLPVSLQVAKDKMKISPEVAHFSLPLCTVINMNGCAAFILTTVLFVAGSAGHVFSMSDLLLMVVMSVVAAIGNAGVPMGCYFLTSAFLISLNIPLGLMGLILPFYTLIDMEETALNVWSDLCVTAMVDKDHQKKKTIPVASAASRSGS